MEVLYLFGGRYDFDTIVYFHSCYGARFQRGNC
jgi:hypothetical protein